MEKLKKKTEEDHNYRMNEQRGITKTQEADKSVGTRPVTKKDGIKTTSSSEGGGQKNRKIGIAK